MNMSNNIAGSRPETDDSERSPFISIVVPIRNEEDFIAATIAELQTQKYPDDRVEILVCDGLSDDRTREIVSAIAEADSRVKLLDNPKRRSSAGRNVGFQSARGDIAIVIDGHVKIGHTDLLANLARCAVESGADCFGRPQPLIPSEPGGWAEAIAHGRASKLGHSPASFIHSGHEGFAPAASMGAAYRRHVFEKIGYVDETFDACEDLDFNTRVDEAGLRCFTSPSLTVYYYARQSIRGLFWQMYRYGFGRYKYLRKHPTTLSPYQLAPALLVLNVLLIPVWALIAPLLMWVGIAATAFYGLVSSLVAFSLARQTTWKHLARYLVIFPTIHSGIGVGWLMSLLRGGRLTTEGP